MKGINKIILSLFLTELLLKNIIGLIINQNNVGSLLQSPAFLQEPPSRLVFSNDSGSQISCSAHGNPPPIVTWLLKDGTVVNGVPGLRQMPGNGTLYFPPFLGQYFRADVHENYYRCRASNQAGTILSRDVYVRAVVRESYDIRIEGKEVLMGNAAFLRCLTTENAKEFVSITSWYCGDDVLLPELSNIGGRYFVTSGNGDLFIRSVRADDNLKRFSCLTMNSLTGERKMSEVIQLSIKEPPTNLAPQLNQKPSVEVTVDRGLDIHLQCNAQGNPLPTFTWFRVSDSGALYPVPTSQRIIPSQAVLLIKNADERDLGIWVCKVSNQFGEQKIEIRLTVRSYLAVHIHPQVQIINSGGRAMFNCTINGHPIGKIDWIHDGKPIFENNMIRDPNKIKLVSPTSLIVNNVERADRGMYQCMVTNKRSSAQAMAELKLGDIIPEMIYTFIEQNVRPGPHISLKCSATGSPPPEFTWLLDTQPIIDVSSLHRYAIGQFVDGGGDVISHLNISHVRTDDGGLYHCIASNSVGEVSHAARLNVYGPPYVRSNGPIRAVAGSDLIVHCPFSGYPVETIRWEKSGQEILSNSRYSIANVQEGGMLKINQVDSSYDSGVYTCIVRSRTGDEARQDMQLMINSPPVIEPFTFPKNLQEGGRAQVSCSVSSGDMPVYFSWKKDDVPIPISLQIMEKKDEFFTLLIFKDITARHSGKYTCFATNAAAKVNYTAELLVRVAPHWTYEPKDTAIMLGNPIVMHCEAGGFPEPTITWFRGQGKMSKDFQSIIVKNNSLTINFATPTDEGYYMCQANNNIGTGLKKIIHINVNEPARFDLPLKNISSKRNEPVVLNCLAMGDDPINIVWSHNNARIDLNNYRLSIAEFKTDNGVNSQLSISRSDRHDSGKYLCIAENPFGRSEHIIYLAVQERPDPPSELEVVEVKSRAVRLSWRRPYDGNSPVLSYFVQYQTLKSVHSQTTITNDDWNNSHTVNLTLPTIIGTKNRAGDLREQASVGGLQPATTYLIRMLAINEIEHSTYTDVIVIKTQEEAPTEAPQNVQVQTGGIGELVVIWQVPSRESWNGELLGYTVNCTEEKQNINYIASNSSLMAKSITIHGWATTKTSITNLRKYTRYAITIRAFNGFDAGPWSPSLIGTTLEGVPEAPPQHVNCSSLSSQSIKITWREPLLQFHGGVIQGYKILYTPLVKQIELSSATEVKRTSNMETYLHALYKATNYSIRVLAYTSSGDGIDSKSIYCTTEEDVPDPPANIKTAALTADSILVAWMTPVHRNGIIIHYTVYAREVGRKGQAKSHLVRVDENGLPVTFEARGLNENQLYEFWVSATTSIGEGEPTAIVTQSTNTRAPAKIASFSQVIRKAVGSSLVLECIAVGNPTPRARWFTRDRPVTFSPFYEVTVEGNLKIHSVEPSLSGNYTCSAKNLFGEDEIIYTVLALRVPSAPHITLQYTSHDSIRISWEAPEDGGSIIQGYTLSYRLSTGPWHRTEITPDHNGYTLMTLKCGSQYLMKMSAQNRVGDGQSSQEIIAYTKGKVSQAPDEREFIQTNATCLRLQLTAWNNGGCHISHYSIEYRQLGDTRWTVVTSDVSTSAVIKGGSPLMKTTTGNSIAIPLHQQQQQHQASALLLQQPLVADDSRDHVIFCDLIPATWYQLKVSARTDAGKTTAQYNFATTTLDGEVISPPLNFPSVNDKPGDIIALTETSSWLPTVIVGIIILAAAMLAILILRYKGVLCGPISNGYESRAIPDDLKEERENRRNQQVYSASPVKTVDKGNDSEMYEISPYATFNVSGRGGNEGNAGQTNVKTPTRGVTASTLDYTVQFKTFGHPEDDNLNATAYSVLPNTGLCVVSAGVGGGHIKGKSSWHKQRYYNTDDESTLSKSMTVAAGNSQFQSHRIKAPRGVAAGNGGISDGGDARIIMATNRGKGRSNSSVQQPDTESDTSESPTNEFSNAATYRVPVKSSRDIFRPDSSTESNNDQSPVQDRRTNTPRHITADMKTARSRQRQMSGVGNGSGGGGICSGKPKESHSMDILHPRSNNSLDSEVNLDLETQILHFRPPSGFTDSREFNDAECDRERALDLEVQRVMENNYNSLNNKSSIKLLHAQDRIEQEELTSLLIKYQEKKEQERQEYTIHV